MEQSAWDDLAERYHEEVISPFYGGVENPLLNELNSIENSNQKTVAEFGCGLFYLADTLSTNFKKVHASDFSYGMTKKAKERSRHLSNVVIKQEDIRTLKHKNKFDVVISVNSLLMPSFSDLKKSFKNIHDSLKKNGICFMILPSMEAVLYHGSLILHKQLDKHDEATAKRIAKMKFEHKKYDFFTGIYTELGLQQKFYYKHGIKQFLKNAGFKDFEISKVKYPWGKEVSDYEDFPEEDRLWDWFVKAKK